MASLDRISYLKTDDKSHEGKPESQPEAKSPLESDLSLPSVASTQSGRKFKTIIPEKHILRDPNQRVLVLSGKVLLALEDKNNITGASETTRPNTKKGNQIFLAVSEGKLCLYCAKKPKSPTLQLMKIDITNLNSLEEEKRLSFTFIREDIGSYFTLESAANPGYFIYTSNTPRQPVGVTKDLGKENNTHFRFGDL
ncbi:Interleukin-37, partial [Galemys pyrenaicus]